MRHLRNTAIALMAIGGAALIGFAASAQAPYGYYGTPRSGSHYSYGTDRANPGLAPNGWDQNNARDFQLNGRN